MTTEEGIRARESINRLLLSAGYFRVRMSGLEDFDKIAGGLAWCLKASCVDVDVDIFFKEKPNVGEKVKISESICGGLRAAKCPLELKPHQIQGLDFPYLFPVFQWLVKNVIEVRNEFGDFQRSFAEFSFKNSYAELPSDIKANMNFEKSEKNIREIEKFFPPKRFYKRQSWKSDIPELKQIETTLLEYGRIPTLVSAETQRPTDRKQTAQQQQQAEADNAKRNEELKATISSMSREGEVSIDRDIISNFVSQHAENILENQSIFDDSANALAGVTEEELEEQHRAQTEAFNARLASIKADGRKLAAESEDLSGELDAMRARYKSALDDNQRLKSQLEELAGIIEGAQHTEEIMQAMALRDDNQENIERFQKQCKEEIEEWTQRIAELKERMAGAGEGNAAKLAAALAQHQRDWDRRQELVAEKAREVLKLRTEYDTYPTMAELSQYSRRLKELSALSLSKLTEVKKCQELLNSSIMASDTLEKENSLFNTIITSFQTALNNTGMQQNLLSQLTNISKQTTEQKARLAQELEKRTAELQELEERHRKLLEQQRRYFQAVKEYQEAQDTLADLLEEEDGEE